MLINLVLNATDAAKPREDAPARVGVELAVEEGARAVLRVTDSGPGPAAAIENEVFEPFVTDKPEGTGLGLYVARQVAEDHNGALGWRRLGETTCFTLTLPLAGAPPEAAEREEGFKP